MHVVIVGGGLGGLALAAGLRRRDIAVTVLERDTDLARTSGYHITLQQPVQAALQDLLAPEVLQRLLASAADGRRRDPDALWDRRGRHLGTLTLKSEDVGIDVDRITLRTLLADAVGDDLQRGRVVTRATRSADGVTAHLEDGSTIEADVLVGADGVHSTIARDLAGTSTNRPTGLVGISGRTLAADLDDAQRTRLGPRSSLAVGPGATALYLGYLDPVGHAVLDLPEARRSVTTEPTYIWGAMLRESPTTRRLAALDARDLRDATADLLTRRGWSTCLTDVVRRGDASTTALFGFHAGPTAAADQAPWSTSAITALGDAVHATPPTAGMGAGAAIRDAADLCRELGEVRSGAKPLLLAVRDFETDMRERGADVVATAMTTVRQVLATDTPVGATITRLALPVLAGTSALRGRAAMMGP